MAPRGEERVLDLVGGEINGYPFTTFTDLSDFLGIIPRVSSDDLAYYVEGGLEVVWRLVSGSF